jgi:hypothetical protein
MYFQRIVVFAVVLNNLGISKICFYFILFFVYTSLIEILPFAIFL